MYSTSFAASSAGVSFLQQDVRRAWPDGPFQLVLCRNVVCTYFAPELQRRVLEALATRLGPGGVLVLGKGETLPEDTPGFLLEPGGLPVYRKAART